jgi:ribonuclease Z
VVLEGDRHVLVDAGSNPLARLQQAGLDPLQTTDIIITHFHPDHTSGMPLFIMGSWMFGRKNQLNILGLDVTLKKVKANLDLYEWETWPELFDIEMIPLVEEEDFLVMDSEFLRIKSSPVMHLIPTIGLRFEFLRAARSMAYSSDIKPYESIINLAWEVDTLLHVATAGEMHGHTSAEQAGKVAETAKAKPLY